MPKHVLPSVPATRSGYPVWHGRGIGIAGASVERSGRGPILARVVCAGLALLAGSLLLSVARGADAVTVLGAETETRVLKAESVVLEPFINDPIRPLNVGFFALTKGAMDGVIRPLAYGWEFIIPEPGRQSISNVSRNAAYPVRLVSLLLQGRLKDSGSETGHFLINSTLGVAGLFDPAGHFGVLTRSEDVGQAFGSWGVGPGFYLFIPLMGPSSGRDGVGRVFDTALTPTSYVPGLSWFFAFNSLSLNLEPYDALVRSQRDLYGVTRAMWAVKRQVDVEDYTIPEAAFASAGADLSLGALTTRPTDASFAAKARDRRVRLATTGRTLPYSLWLQDGPGPLVFLVPGIGTYRKGSTPLALAELLHGAGCSVVTISNVFHPEFLVNGLTRPFPAYTPADAADVRAALAAIHAQLTERYPERFTDVRLLGYSLGGIQALFIAADQRLGKEASGLNFSHIAALNPPFDLFAASRRFDEFYRIPLAWPDAERQERVRDIALRAYTVVTQGVPEGRPLPFTEEESHFLIGVGGRDILVNTLRVVGPRCPEEQIRWKRHDGDLTEALNRYSFAEYVERIVLPYYAMETPGTSMEDLIRTASLSALTERLGASKNVRIVTNADDFVLGQEGLEWVRRTLGERASVFPAGGHLGNLMAPAVRDAIVASLGLEAPL